MIVCITNFPAEFTGNPPRPCTVRDQHTAHCNDTACTGCFPREAVAGTILCRACWYRLQQALNELEPTITHLRSIQTAGQPTEDRVSSSRVWQIPIPATWLFADEILEACGSSPIPTLATVEEAQEHASIARAFWADPEKVASTARGAVSAVNLSRLIARALRSWPHTAEEHEVPKSIRCSSCLQRTLYQRPPLAYHDDAQVICRSCGHTQEWFDFLRATQTFADQYLAAQKDLERQAKKLRKAKNG